MSDNQTPARPEELNMKAATRCPSGECVMSWEYPADTSFGVPTCQICKRINGHALQQELNELLAKERAWALGRVRFMLTEIPPGSRYRWKAVDADMVFLSRAIAIVGEVENEGAKRR